MIGIFKYLSKDSLPEENNRWELIQSNPKIYFTSKGNRDEAYGLVKKYHYSHRVPSNIQLIGSFYNDTEQIAACFFSIPPTRWGEEVWELSRLVRKENVYCPPLTKLISETCGIIRKEKLIDLVVSYADYTWNHHGGIYQAASWNFHGKREERMDGVIINNDFVPGRTCNSIYGTRSPTKLSELIDNKIEPHYDKGKFLYWKVVLKPGIKKAERLNLKKEEYPKPNHD